MKTDFCINVNVSIGVTPEVVALVTSILTKQPTATVEAPASEQPAAEAPGVPYTRREAFFSIPSIVVNCIMLSFLC